MKRFYFISVVLLGMTLTACGGDEDKNQVCVPMNDGVNVTISVTQPTANDVDEDQKLAQK